MKIGVKKRGLSPVIASVLLILLVVVIVSMIFIWARTFFSSQTEDSERSIGELCSGVLFVADVVESSGDYTLEISNKGNVDIDSFELRKYSDGRVETDNVSMGVSAGGSVANVTFSEKMEDGATTPEKVEIFAVLSAGGSGRLYTCYDEPEFLVY